MKSQSKSMYSQRGQVLIIVVGAMLFGGGGSAAILANVQGHTPSEIKKAIKKNVTDETRKGAALTVVEDWGKSNKEPNKALGKAQKELLKIVMQDSAKLGDAAEFTAQIDAAIKETDRNFLDMRFGLKAQLTKSEWDAGLARQTK